MVPAPTTAEIDDLLGRPARLAFLADLAAGRLLVGALEREDYAVVLAVEDRYADLELGLADCALIALAHRHQTTRIMTFDERRFRAVAPVGGGAFTILPADGTD